MLKKETTNLIFILLLAGTVRFLFLPVFWDKPLTIVDEKHYQALAENLLESQTFGFEKNQPTALRPPLYPFFLWLVYSLSHGIHFNLVRIFQIILGLASVLMVYLIGKKIFDYRTGLISAFLYSIYPSFIFFSHLLLTEILGIFLFLIFLWLSLLFIQHKKYFFVFFAGLFLGLSALTRSVLYPFILVFLLYVFCDRGSFQKKMAWVALTLSGFLIVVLPWTIRNAVLFKEFVVVDALGGINLYVGNYEHTPSDKAWTAIDIKGEKAFSYGHEAELQGMNIAEKSSWATKMAIKFMWQHKWLTVKRTLIKAANFWGLEREIVGFLVNDHFPNQNKKLWLILVTPFVFSFYILVVLSSIFGICYNFHNRHPFLILTLLLLIYFTALHGITLGHSRYHLPLIPLLMLYSAWSLANLKEIFQERFHREFKFSVVISILFIAIWTREIIFVEGARFLQYLL